MISILRPLGAILTLACVAAALHSFAAYGNHGSHWWWLGAALFVAIAWQWRLPLPGVMLEPRLRERASQWRIVLGLVIGLVGAALWGAAIWGLYESWTVNFDRSWVALPIAAAGLAIGFDLAWGRLPRGDRPAVVGRLALSLLGLLALAAVYRLWNLTDIPGVAGITQVEELQTGMWGVGFLQGGRLRWEYLSSAWLAALGIWMGGPTLNAMRLPFTLVSTLKVLPIFFWLRFAVGTVGASVGTALFVFSAWDVVLSHIPTNHNALVVATAFALLAGPARRGRPSAYVWLGLFGGYVLYEYVALRPLTFFVLAGAVWLSWRDVHSGWLLRLGRPLITVVLVISMALPLFLRVLSPPNRIWNEYFNGWNRARVQAYYDPNDTWSEAVQRRVDRSYEAAALFFFSGDPHPARQVNQPLVDPVTAAFLLVGLGYAIGHATEPIFGLTLVALLATAAGSLVMTGNLDVVRVGGAVPYVYALAGYGAASLVALVRARGRRVRFAALGLLVAAVIWAGWLNTQALLEHWASTSVHRASRSNLAYLSGWLGANVRDGERVIAIAPGFFNVLQPNDAAWLRRREMEGLAAWDVESALRYWTENPGRAVLVVFAGGSTPAVKEYLEWLLPGLTLELRPDPLEAGGDLAYAHLDAVPPQLAAALTRGRCRGVTAEYRLVGAQPGEPLLRVTSVAPFVDTSTMPGSLREQVYRSQPPVSRVLVRYQASIVVPAAGEYRFQVETYPGEAELRLDGQPYRQGSQRTLQAGAHSLEVQVSLEPSPTQMSVRLFWGSPQNRNEREIMPIYRLSAVDPACKPAAAARAAASAS